MKKIEGIRISIWAGPYMENMTDPEEGPAHVVPEYVENGEITLTSANSVMPIGEVREMASNMAENIQKKYERSKTNGNN